MTRRKAKAAHSIRIDDWNVDAVNEEELALHGLSLDTIEEVATNEPRFKQNKRRHTATHQMIGPDDGGKTWVVCIVEITLGLWRPITGWEAANDEKEWWRRSK